MDFAACHPGKDPMPGRFAIAILAMSLAAGPAQVVVRAAELTFDTGIHPQDAVLADAPCQVGPLCDDHFCPLSFASRPGCWVVQADALALHRTSGCNRPLIVAANSGETVLETSDLDLGFELGPRLLLGHRTGPDRRWELVYFGLFEWSATVVAEEANNLDIPGTLVGVAQDFTAADQFAIDYTTRLHNAEANLVRDRDTWSALAGLRYLHLDEDLTLTASDSDSGRSDYTAQSQSDLIGGQLGLRTGRLRDRWGWDLTLKAGLYGSVLSQEQLLLDNNNVFVLRDASARTGSAAFLGDIHLAGFYQLNDVWSLRGGYYAMYVAGIALAPDQLDFDNLVTSGQQVSRGDLFLHGASLGLEARW
jgi:hypothetical protein